MPTLNQIAESVYLDRRVNDLLSKLEPADLRQDLLQHCIMYLLNIGLKNPLKIESIWERGEMFAWFQACLKMELMGKNSSFRRRYRVDNDTEEVLMTNERIGKIADSQQVTAYQQEQDLEASERFGGKFVDYFYQNFHRRNEVKPERKQAQQIDIFAEMA